MKREILITQKYLLIPVTTSGTPSVVSFYDENNKIYEFSIPVADTNDSYTADFYAPLPVNTWLNKTITIDGEVPVAFLDGIQLSDQAPTAAASYSAIHFVPTSGWINDPNGLVYQNGTYHLFFQHNPFHVEWGNMSWGHAISKDLLHWEQLEDVMFPDADGTIFSGCAMINDREELNLSKETILFFYTSAGNTSNWSKDKAFTQQIAYSLDGGNTLIRMDGCFLNHIVGENRDPKVYWHDNAKVYYMILYLDKNDFAIFHSPDLEHWEMTQKLTLPGAWECPDLREIPIEGGASKWMCQTADGYYYLGAFDGHRFETDGIRHEAYASKLPYAAQTFYGTDRVITIPWMRTINAGQVYRGMMGIPRQLTLVERNGKYVLRQKLIDEFETRKSCFIDYNMDFASFGYRPFEVVFNLEENSKFTLNIGNTKCIFAEDVLRLDCLGETHKLELDHECQKISFLFDQELLEVTVDDGLACAAYEIDGIGTVYDVSVSDYDNAKFDIFVI